MRFPLILKKTLLMLWLDDEHNHYEDSVIDPTYTQKKKKIELYLCLDLMIKHNHYKNNVILSNYIVVIK